MKKVLRPRFAQTFEHYGVWLIILPPLSVLVLPAVVIALFLDPSKVGEFYSALLEKDKLFDLLLPMAILLPVTIGLMGLMARSRLELSEDGILFVSGMPDFLKQQVDWQLHWDEMESVQLRTPPMSHPLTAAIQIKTANGPARRLVPWQWVEPGDTPNQSTRGQLLFGRKHRFQTLVANTPLAQAFQAAGKLAQHASDEIEADAIQNADAPSKVIAGLFVAAVAYFIGDSYFGLEEYYVGTPPWQWHFAIGLFTALAAWLVLNSGKSSALQAPFIALLFGGGMALAAYPGLLRLNAWLDPAELVSYEYTLGANDTWATDGGAPDLVFDIDSRYWDQFELGDAKEFQLRDGGLGFAQVNMAPIYVEQRAFYADTSVSLATDQSEDP